MQSETWRLLSAGSTIDGVPPAGAIIVPLGLWLEAGDVLAQRAQAIGVWLDGADNPAYLANNINQIALIAVRFAALGDGRGFSTGRLLRERYGFRGTLRAFGAIIADQLWELTQSGFDEFVLPEEANPLTARAALRPFSDAYHGSVIEPLPYFRRQAGV